MTKVTGLVVLLALVVAGVAVALVARGGGGEDTVEVRLEEENESGQSGTATLSASDDGKTKVVVELDNPPGVAQPSHVHPGSCGDLRDPIAALTSIQGGKSETTVEMSLAELQRGGLVVHAHKSEAEYDTSVACGEIPKAD